MPELENDKDRAAKGDRHQQTLTQWLNSPRFREGMARILPKHLESERFHSLILRQLSAEPKLAQCTPMSVVGGMMQLATLGLEPGVNGEAWLIPYDNRRKVIEDGKEVWITVTEAGVQIGYLGHLALAWRSERVSSVQCNYVMKGDHFKHQHGTNGMIEHIPADDRPVDPKMMTHAYGIIETTYGGQIWWVLNTNEVERIRNSSPSKNSPAWKNWYMEMAMGKALKRALKFAPKTREMARAITLDDEHDASVPQEFDMDIPENLLPANVKTTPAQRQAADMMEGIQKQRDAAAANGSDEPPPPGDEDGPTIPADVIDDREPVLAGAERAANREQAAEKAASPPPADDGPQDAPDDGVGDMGW